jgi:phage FluMu protein Com
MSDNGQRHPENEIKFQEFHCTKCGRFLALYAIVEGSIIIRCKRCKTDNVMDVRAEGVVFSDDPLELLTSRPSSGNLSN